MFSIKQPRLFVLLSKNLVFIVVGRCAWLRRSDDPKSLYDL